MKRIFTLSLISLSIIFSACVKKPAPQPETPREPENPQVLTGKAEHYDGGSRTFDTFHYGALGYTSIGTGVITADGDFSVQLDEVMPNSVLLEAGGPSWCQGLKVTPSPAKWVYLPYIEILEPDPDSF